MLEFINTAVMNSNRKDANAATWVYFDEIYLLLRDEESAKFLYQSWKRFRKYGATLTGITQNVEECLLSNTARMMFANSEFLLMLNQATTDREQLARLLGASDTQMSYAGQCPCWPRLIKVGGASCLSPMNCPRIQNCIA